MIAWTDTRLAVSERRLLAAGQEREGLDDGRDDAVALSNAEVQEDGERKSGLVKRDRAAEHARIGCQAAAPDRRVHRDDPQRGRVGQGGSAGRLFSVRRLTGNDRAHPGDDVWPAQHLLHDRGVRGDAELAGVRSAKLATRGTCLSDVELRSLESSRLSARGEVSMPRAVSI